MLRKLSLSAVAVSLFASLALAEDIKIDFDGKKGALDIKEQIADVTVPEVAPDQEASKKVPAEWTIMLFSNAKNDLEQYLLSDLNEMELVGSTAKLNLVAEVGRIEGYDSSDGDWKGVRRYHITKDADMTKMGSKMLEDLGMIDMGDYKNVVSFVQWAKKAYPAKKYMLIISNHGSGWEKGMIKARVSKGISYDEQSGNNINTPQLGLALKEIGKLDVFSTDACLMRISVKPRAVLG